MMVWLAAENCHGSIHLLGEKQPHHLVGKCHA